MSRHALLAVVLCAASVGVVAQQQNAPTAVNITGKWAMTLEMEVGTASPALVFTQDDEKLVGTYTGRYGEYPLVGKVVGRTIEFVVTINAEGTETKMHFSGEISDTPQGLLLKGAADLGGMGEAGWLARRVPQGL